MNGKALDHRRCPHGAPSARVRRPSDASGALVTPGAAPAPRRARDRPSQQNEQVAPIPVQVRALIADVSIGTSGRPVLLGLRAWRRTHRRAPCGATNARARAFAGHRAEHGAPASARGRRLLVLAWRPVFYKVAPWGVCACHLVAGHSAPPCAVWSNLRPIHKRRVFALSSGTWMRPRCGRSFVACARVWGSSRSGDTPKPFCYWGEWPSERVHYMGLPDGD